MNTLSSKLDHLNAFIGKSVSWLSLLLVLVIIIDVLMRYLFSVTSSASFELEWHLFAALFLLSAGWTLQQDKHVRVDVFYQKFSDQQKAWVNILGTLFLLLPFCVVGLAEGFRFALNAYLLGETSPDPGGLPARFIIKSTIPAGFLLLGLQGISILIKSAYTLFNKKEELNKGTR